MLTNSGYSIFIKSIIVAATWFIWKNKCDKFFRNSNVNCNVIACRAMIHILDFLCLLANLGRGKTLLLNNFSNDLGAFRFVSSHWNAADEVSGVKFFCSTSNYFISFAGSCSIQAHNAADAELNALKIAIDCATQRGILIRHLFLTNTEAFKVVFHLHPREEISDVHHLLNIVANPHVHLIPQTWAFPALRLATHGINLHGLNLFLHGRDLSRWIMKCFRSYGFEF